MRALCSFRYRGDICLKISRRCLLCLAFSVPLVVVLEFGKHVVDNDGRGKAKREKGIDDTYLDARFLSF